MATPGSVDLLHQRWTSCLACGHPFESVLYRCLHCSDLAHSAHSTSSLKNTRSDLVLTRASSAVSGSFSPASSVGGAKEVPESVSSDQITEERASHDAFHVCPDCVRKASLFHPVRHVFVRVDFPWVVKRTNTHSLLMQTDESHQDYFDAPEAKFLSGNVCTLGNHRRHTTTLEDATIWESFIHTHIINIVGIRNLKTINTKYHKVPCDRCKARICGIRWERLCSAVSITVQKQPSSMLLKTANSLATPSAAVPIAPISPNSSSMRAYTQGDPMIQEADSITHQNSSGSFGSSFSSFASSIAASFTPHSSSSGSTSNLRSKRKSGSASRTLEKENSVLSITPVQTQTPHKSISLCTHCFDTLHSDFSSSPLGHKHVENQEHEDSYYTGHLWAHVRCLFDSATQPLLQTLDDEVEIERSDSMVGKHEHVHHSHSHTHSHYVVQTLSSTNQLPLSGSDTGAPQSPSLWEKRHIGSDQSTQSSSSGSGHYPISDSSNVSRADRTMLKASTIHLDDSVSGMEEWVLLEPVTNPYDQFMSDEERDEGYGFDSGSDDGMRFGMNSPPAVGADKFETLFDASKRQALKFIQDDDLMRPDEVSKALEPFHRAIEEPKKPRPASNGDEDAYGSSTLAGDGFTLDEPEPVFELTPDLQSELAAHKARSIFEYGLDRDMAPFSGGNAKAPTSAPTTFLGGLPPLSELSKFIDIVPTDNFSPRNDDPYGPTKGYHASHPYAPTSFAPSSQSSSASLPPGYTNPYSSSSTSLPSGYMGTPYLPSIASEGSYSSTESASLTNSARDPSNFHSSSVSSIMPYATITASPYTTPNEDGRIGPGSPPQGDGNETNLHTHNHPYYSASDIKPEAIKGNDGKSTPIPAEEIPFYVPIEGERDWNSEWQTLIKEVVSLKLDCVLLSVTSPQNESTDFFSERERSMTAFLQDIGSLEDSALEDLYQSTNEGPNKAPSHISSPMPSRPPKLARSNSSIKFDEQSDNEAIRIARELFSDPSNMAKKMVSVREELAELKHLKTDRNAFSQMVYCVIRLKNFLAEFTETASRIAKTIVSEVSLPLERKSIKPRRLGGIAGGEKFLEEGIFFKFAIDAYKIYGGDKFAMKAAGHELQGLMAYMDTDTPGLHVPLSTIVDYAGYRVVASARLPISSDTLIYGSSDGGKTIHRKDPVFNKMMEDASLTLNIKQHEVAPGVSLHSAVDMEGHKGADGRYYVLDTARVFPPEPPLRTFVAVIIPPDSTQPHRWAPSPPICEMELVANRSRWREQVLAYLAQTSRSLAPTHYNLLDGQVHYLHDSRRQLPLNSRASALVSRIVRGPAVYVIEPGQRSTQLFNLLRSAYVARQPHALSSDAFTSFGRIDQDVHNTEVEDAFYRLLGIDIPMFVKYLTAKENYNLTHLRLMDIIKNYGINFRLLGFLRSHIPNETSNRALRSTILVEMVTRVAKNDLRASLRSARRIRKSDEICLTPQASDRQAQEIALSAFNLLLGNSTSSNFMWHSFMKTHIICKYGQYGQALTEAELDATYDLRSEINKLQLFQTLQMQLGVRFKDEVLVKFQRRPELFEASAPFSPEDLDGLYPKPKTGLEIRMVTFFVNMVKMLPTMILRMEAARGFYGVDSRELGFNGLMLAHILNKFDSTRHRVPDVIKSVFQVFSEVPGLTPAEVTCKAFFLLSSASLSAGKLELAEAQLKASYHCYRRALTSHVASRPSELGCSYLLLILDRLCSVMMQQNRKFEAWYYAQRFVRIWLGMPYPGEMKDLEMLAGRNSPLAFALLWERDFYFSGGQQLFFQNGQIVDNSGNIYTNVEDFVVDRRTGSVVRKSNLLDENLQEMTELTPQARLAIESTWFKKATPEDRKAAELWCEGFKTTDSSPYTAFTMATQVWVDWVESGAWKRERLFDSRAIRTARWTPSVGLMYNRTIVHPNPISPNMSMPEIPSPSDEPLPSPLPSTSRSLDNSGGHKVIASSTTSVTSKPGGPSAVSPVHLTNFDSLHSSSTSTSTGNISAQMIATTSAIPTSIPMHPSASSNSIMAGSPALGGPSPLAGTITSSHALKSGLIPVYSFTWHLGTEWAPEIVGSECFVLVRYEPNVWIVPSFVNRSMQRSNPQEVSSEGRRILTGTEVGQFIEGEHQVIATMPARLMRKYGTETWTNLNLDYGNYQVLLVTAAGRLWGRGTSKPCFVLSNVTVVLNSTVKHHVLRWSEAASWLTPVFQAQGISFSNITYIPLGSGYTCSYWTDTNGTLWYGFTEPHSHVPPYLLQPLPVEEVLRLQTYPATAPAPTDFAYTFQRFASILGNDIGVFASAAVPAPEPPPTFTPPPTPVSSSTSVADASGYTMSSTTTSDSPRSGQTGNDEVLERAPSGVSLASSLSSSTRSSSKQSSAGRSSRSNGGATSQSAAPPTKTPEVLTEKFWHNTGERAECNKVDDISILHYDAHGVRIPPGPNATNTVIAHKQVESQISSTIMWSKMRKLPALAQEKVLKVTASNTHVMALLANGDVFTWGNNLYGELGHGDLVRIEEPRVVKRLRGKQVRDIACGVGRSVALLAGNRSVYQWGMDFSLFPEPHYFWKSLPDEEVTKVVFQSQNGTGTPSSFSPDSVPVAPFLPRDMSNYGIFEEEHNTTANTLYHSNLMLYLTDTGRAYLYGHDPFQLIFKQQTPQLLDIFDGHPVLDAQIGSNFMTFIGEEGAVWSTGYNELGQCGTGVVGDPSTKMMERVNQRLNNQCNPRSDRVRYQQPKSNHPVQTPRNRESKPKEKTEKSEKKEKKEKKDKKGRETMESSSSSVSLKATPVPSLMTMGNIVKDDWSTSTGPKRVLSSQGPGSTVMEVAALQRLLQAGHPQEGSKRSTSPAHALLDAYDTSDIDEARENHPLNFASLPVTATKVSFQRAGIKITKISVRGKKVYALDHFGHVWHWGNGTFLPQPFGSSHEGLFVTVGVVATPSGAIVHTGNTPPPVQTMTERGRTRRKALGLESPNNYEISARSMLLMPSGNLKHYVDGTPIPAKGGRIVLSIDWKRPPPGLLDRGEEIRFVTPGMDHLEGLPRQFSEISVIASNHLQRRGNIVVDYLEPTIVKWSIDQGISSGLIDKFVEPILEWAPLTEEARDSLVRRRDRRTARVRNLLVERQTKLQQDAKAWAEAKYQEARASSWSFPSTANSSFSTLPSLNIGSGLGAGSNSGTTISTQPSGPPPLLSRASKLSLLHRTHSFTSIGSLNSGSPFGIGSKMDSSTSPHPGASTGHIGTPPLSRSTWDGNAAFLDVESSSNHGGAEDLGSDASSTTGDRATLVEVEEYAPMVPPGEYEVVFVVTKPTLQVVARSAPIRLCYDGIKASIDLEASSVSSEKPVIAHWKCELKLPGLNILARDADSNKILIHESLRQRTSGSIRWRLPAGTSYRLSIERSDEAGNSATLAETSLIEVSAAQSASAFGNASMLSALSTMPTEVETVSEWSTFFKQCNLPASVVPTYSQLFIEQNIETSFIASLDSGVLEKIGITSLQHQVAILSSVTRRREQHVRAIMAQELQKMLAEAGNCSQFETSSNSSYPH